MKIGILCSSDWAGFGMNILKSLQSVNVDCIGNALTLHQFGYKEQLPVITVSQINETYKDCDIVLMVHSDWELIEYMDNQTIINFATGTKYRQGYELINTKFSSPFTLIALPEFQVLAPNPKYLVGAIETNLPVKPVGERLVVGHFPSNPSVKGTNDIVRVVRELQRTMDFDFITSVDRVSHAENLERMNQCDVYIELMAPTQGGKPYGSFGVSCLEAGSLGKIVLTQNLNDNMLYYNTYGQPFFSNMRGEADLVGLIRYFIGNMDKVVEIQETTKLAVQVNHSYIATGNKLMSYLNEL